MGNGTSSKIAKRYGVKITAKIPVKNLGVTGSGMKLKGDEGLTVNDLHATAVGMKLPKKEEPAPKYKYVALVSQRTGSGWRHDVITSNDAASKKAFTDDLRGNWFGVTHIWTGERISKLLEMGSVEVFDLYQGKQITGKEYDAVQRLFGNYLPSDFDIKQGR